MTAKKTSQASRRQFLKKACGAGVGMAAGVSGLSRAWAITPAGDDTDAHRNAAAPVRQ
jgi:hypothetical protein